MTKHIRCISPVDGRVYVDRPPASQKRNRRDVVQRARRAEGVAQGSGQGARRAGGRRRRRAEGDGAGDRRGARLADGPADPLRPGRTARPRRARPLHGLDRRRDAGADRAQGRAPRLRALHRARAGGDRLHHRAVELSLSDDRQLRRAGADRRQCRAAEAGGADLAGRRSLPEGVRSDRPAEGPADSHRARARPDGSDHRRRPCRPCRLHRVGRRRADHGAGGGGNVHHPRPRTRRQGSGLCDARGQPEVRGRESGRRRLLQFRPVLLRHRAHLRPRVALRRLPRGLCRADLAIRARRSAR